MRPPYKPVHAIALRLIFEAVFPPEGFLDPSLSAGPDSPWCRAQRTRKALTLVCRDWRQVALPFLYRDVVIRRMGQMAALRRTIDSNPTFYSQMIRSFTILCNVSLNFRALVSDCLASLLNRCTRLKSLSFGPMFAATLDCMQCIQQPMLTSHRLVRPEASRIQRLEYSWSWHGNSHFPDALADIGVYRNLVHLKVFTPPQSNDRIAQTVRLPALKSITFMTVESLGTSRDPYSLASFCSWELPQLEEIRFRPYLDLFKFPLSFEEFFEQQVPPKVLDIGCRSVGEEPTPAPLSVYTKLGSVLQGKPPLHCLVIPARSAGLEAADSVLRHIEIKHVDLWTSLLDTRTVRAFMEGQLPPLWKSMRLLDPGLSVVPEVPHLLPPTCQAEERDAYVHDVFGMRIVETRHSLVRQDQPWDFPGGDSNVYALFEDGFRSVSPTARSSSDSSDGLYTPSEHYACDHEDDLSSDEISDGETNYLRGLVDDPPEQVTMEAALELFSITLDD